MKCALTFLKSYNGTTYFILDKRSGTNTFRIFGRPDIVYQVGLSRLKDNSAYKLVLFLFSFFKFQLWIKKKCSYKYDIFNTSAGMLKCMDKPDAKCRISGIQTVFIRFTPNLGYILCKILWLVGGGNGQIGEKNKKIGVRGNKWKMGKKNGGKLH